MISLNSFSSFIEVMIAFNAAFLIGNKFVEIICTHFYFKKSTFDVKLSTATGDINTIILYHQNADLKVEELTKKENYFKDLLEDCKKSSENVNKFKLADINIYCLISMVYSIIMLLVIPLEEKHPIIINYLLSTFVLLLTLWSGLVFLKHYNEQSENEWFSNPIKSLWIMLISLAIILCLYLVFNYNQFSLNHYLIEFYKKKTILFYLLILILPYIHFIVFLCKIYIKISTNEKLLLTKIEKLEEKIKTEIEQSQIFNGEQVSVIVE